MGNAFRKFKSLICFFVSVLMGFVGEVSAQPLDKEAFAVMVEENSELNCPYELDGVRVNKIFFDADYLHFDFTMLDIYMFGRNTEEMKIYFANLLRHRCEPKPAHDLYEKLVEIRGGLIYDLTLDSSRRSFSLQYTPDEYLQIWNDRQKPEYQDSVKWLARHEVFMEIYLENLYTFTPRTSDKDFMNLDTAYVKDDTVFYYISVCDSLFQFVSETRDEWMLHWDNILLFDGEDNPLLNMLTFSDYDLCIIYENLSHTDSLHLDYPNELLARMLEYANRFTHATDEQMEEYMRSLANSQDWVQALENHSDFYKVQEIEYHDRTVYFTFMIYEGRMDFTKTSESVESLKQFLCSMIKKTIELTFEVPDIIDDTVLVSWNDFYRYIKGIHVLMIEESSRKALDFDILTDDILNAKLPAIPADQVTEDMIVEQIIADRFVTELEKFNKEECPVVSGYAIIDSLVYDYQNLHFYCHVESFRLVVNDSNEVKNLMRKQLEFSMQERSYLADNIRELKSGIMIHYRIPASDTTIVVRFSPSEMAEMMFENTLSERENAFAALSDLINATNAQLPYMLDLLTRLDTLYIDRGNLVFHYTLLDHFEMMKKNISGFSWYIRYSLSSEDVNTQYLMLLCVRSGYGICYRYSPVSKSKKRGRNFRRGNVINICLPVEELEGLLVQ